MDIGRQTLNAWTHATADHLTPIGGAIKAEVLQVSELQVDETSIEYLKPGHRSTKSGYLWIYNDPLGKTCYYDWHAGRGYDCLLDFLGYDEETNTIGYAGTLQCDGYGAYLALAARFLSIRLGRVSRPCKEKNTSDYGDNFRTLTKISFQVTDKL